MNSRRTQRYRTSVIKTGDVAHTGFTREANVRGSENEKEVAKGNHSKRPTARQAQVGLALAWDCRCAWGVDNVCLFAL